MKKNAMGSKRVLFCLVLITGAVELSKSDSAANRGVYTTASAGYLSNGDPVYSYVSQSYNPRNVDDDARTTTDENILDGIYSSPDYSTTSTTTTEGSNRESAGGVYESLMNFTIQNLDDLYNSTDEDARIATLVLHSLGG